MRVPYQNGNVNIRSIVNVLKHKPWVFYKAQLLNELSVCFVRDTITNDLER